MFAVHEVTVVAGFDSAAARLTHYVNHGRLSTASAAAYEGGLDVGLRVGPFGEIHGLSKLVGVRFAEPIARDGSLAMPLRWEAAGPAGDLFPVLDADLTLADAGNGRTRLRLSGSYRPPFGRAGTALDRAVMSRVASATIRSLVERVAETIADPVPESRRTGDPAARWWPASDMGESGTD